MLQRAKSKTKGKDDSNLGNFQVRKKILKINFKHAIPIFRIRFKEKIMSNVIAIFYIQREAIAIIFFIKSN